MILDLVRHTFTERSTIGSLAVDGMFECFTLENPKALNPDLGPEHIAIPCGTFPVRIRWSNHFHRQLLAICGVPDRTDIEFHPGNAAKDTLGCILPGQERGNNIVFKSLEAFEALFAKVRGACDRSEEILIEITETAITSTGGGRQ